MHPAVFSSKCLLSHSPVIVEVLLESRKLDEAAFLRHNTTDGQGLPKLKGSINSTFGRIRLSTFAMGIHGVKWLVQII